MNLQEYMQLLERQAAADAQVVLAKLANQPAERRRGLFIDCGSNLGQGYRQFCKHYPQSHFDYVLIEPNPNCWPALESAVAAAPDRVSLIKKAASTRDGVVQFFGLEHDPTSQGGSMLADHNSKYYEANAGRALDVPCFSLAAFIDAQTSKYGATVLKLDIEGGEYEVLPDLFEHGSHKHLDAAYIEFHSQYMAEPGATEYGELESRLKARMMADGVPLRIWI